MLAIFAGLLVRLAREVRDAEDRFRCVVIHARPEIVNYLNVTHLNKLLRILPIEAEALSWLTEFEQERFFVP